MYLDHFFPIQFSPETHRLNFADWSYKSPSVDNLQSVPNEAITVITLKYDKVNGSNPNKSLQTSNAAKNRISATLFWEPIPQKREKQRPTGDEIVTEKELVI